MRHAMPFEPARNIITVSDLLIKTRTYLASWQAIKEGRGRRDDAVARTSYERVSTQN